jgi:desulfoferrodoxin (superoxide reductase-like protein)
MKENEKSLSDMVESKTHVEFQSQAYGKSKLETRMIISCNIHGLNCIDMSQKFFEWLKNDKDFKQILEANEVAERI